MVKNGEQENRILRFTHGGAAETGVPVALDFSVNLHPLGMPPAVREYLAGQAVSDAQTYPDRTCGKLRDALALRYGLAPEHILCGNGASALLLAAAQAIRPDLALVTAPSFAGYAYALEAAGIPFRAIPLSEENGFSFTQDTVQEMADTTCTGTELIILCSPNNPVGNTIPPEIFKEMLGLCTGGNRILLTDECFLPFVEDGEERSLLGMIGAHPELLVLRAFTKEYAMPGIRLGWLASSNTGLLARIAGQMSEWSVSGIAQGAGLAALTEPDHAKNALAMLREERAYLTAELAGLGWKVYPSEANFLLFEAEPGLKEMLLRHGILIRSCADFEGLTDRHYRIAVRTHAENEKLISTIKGWR